MDQTAGYLMAHGISDPAVATQKAIAAIALLLTRKTAAGGGAGAH